MRKESKNPLLKIPETVINYSELVPGDFLLVRHDPLGIFKHICVVAESQCDGVNNRIHAAGLSKVTGLIVSPMFSHEELKKANSTVAVVRILDEKIRKNFLAILVNWVSWAVSYDFKRFNNLCNKLSEFYNTEFNPETKTCPNMNEMPVEKISHALSECAKLFRIEDAIKYAQRREVSPIRPKENLKDERGFSCSMSMIAALQAAYVMEKVTPVNDKWCSNRNVFFKPPPLEEALENRKASLEEYKDENEYKNVLINLIPEELRLPPKFTDCDLLMWSIYKGNSLKILGKFSAPDDHLFIHKNEMEEEILKAKKTGQEKKEEFRGKVFGK